MSRSDVVDRVWRMVFWLGYRMARAWWRVRRPHHHGAMVAVWFDGLILGLKQSYTNRITWPGGGIEPGEDATCAAQRELHEELGIVARVEELKLVRSITVQWDNRHDHIRIFELHLTEQPVLKPDNREIVRAAFMRPDQMLAVSTPPFVRAYLLDRSSP
jgi:8-oxo-dGTP pyrophosphatase MutT (NUDIX family)